MSKRFVRNALVMMSAVGMLATAGGISRSALRVCDCIGWVVHGRVDGSTSSEALSRYTGLVLVLAAAALGVASALSMHEPVLVGLWIAIAVGCSTALLRRRPARAPLNPRR